MVAPGSAGFRFCGDNAWLNALLFPVSAEHFVSDLSRLDPTIETRVMSPDDVFEISDRTVRHLAGDSTIAKTEEGER